MIASKMSRPLAVLALAAASALSAQATVVDFEDVTAGFLSPSVTSAGFTFTSGGIPFSGVDTSSFFSAAPANSIGQFLYALNNDTITLAMNGERFAGLDLAFIAPAPIADGVSAGRLQLAAQTSAGLVTEEFDFGLSSGGVWSFISVNSSALSSLSVNSVTFSACLYDGLGGCGIDPLLVSAFAIDNIRVPEPTSVALTLAALGLLAATRRRQTV